MFIDIRDLHKKFVYKKILYHTPVTLVCDRESLSALIFKLQKNNIIDYIISPSKQRKDSDIVGSSANMMIVDDVVDTIRPKRYVDKNDEIKDMLNQILLKTNQISEQKGEQNITYVTPNMTSKKSDSKNKDDEHTFIPEISTSGMGIKSKVEAKKTNNTATDSADVLRQLLKGI